MLNSLIDLIIRIAFGVVFLLIVTPIGLVIRIFGVDSLNRRIDRGTRSYWRKHI